MVQDIDFLPEEYKARCEQRRRQFWRRVVLVCMLLGIVVGWWQQRTRRLELEARRDQLQAEAAATLARLGSPDRLKRQLERRNTEANLIALLKLRPSFSRVLKALVAALPSYVSLTECTLDLTESGSRDLAARPPTTSGNQDAKAQRRSPAEQDLSELRETLRRQQLQATVQGLAPDDLAVYAYIRALLETGLFEKVQLAYTEAYEYGEYRLRSFKLLAVARRPALADGVERKTKPRANEPSPKPVAGRIALALPVSWAARRAGEGLREQAARAAPSRRVEGGRE